MSLEQQTALCSGETSWKTKAVDEFDIPSVIMSDGPNGMRVEKPSGDFEVAETYPATCFPTAALSACSWDENLIAEMAAAIAREAKQQDVDLILGPGMNIRRTPLCGRNFEYFSEDPYLTGRLALAYIQGAESEHVGVAVKHFAVNNQENRRMTIDARIDERALREIYLKGFEIAVKEGRPMAVMTSYNAINGEYMSQNKAMIEGVLRQEWQYEGITITDWSAVYDRVKGVEAGLDLEMPASGGVNDRKVMEAVQSGKLKKSALNAVTERSIDFAFKARENRKAWDENQQVDYSRHHELARRIAAESLVLLKNEDDILPIDTKRVKRLAILGKMAFDPRIQGSGSSRINEMTIDTPYDALTTALEDEMTIGTCQGYSDSDPARNAALLDVSARMAAEADMAVLFLGLPLEAESEGRDRSGIMLPDNQRALRDKVLDANAKTVIVYMNGGVVDLEGSERAAGILEAWLGGEAVGQAVADVLTGAENPCGHLTETIPMRLEDTPAFDTYPGYGDTVVYGEGIFVGYRHYDHQKLQVRYPFGYGLCYTHFDFGDLTVISRGNNAFSVSVTVTNVGDREGKTVVQLYTGREIPDLLRPRRELRAFKKIALAPGEHQVLSFELTEGDFSYYDVPAAAWHTEAGTHLIEIGESSRDICARAEVEIQRNYVPVIAAYSYLTDVMDHPKGPQVVSVLAGQYKEITGQSIDDLDTFSLAVIQSMPVYKLVPVSKGMITQGMVDQFLAFMNDLEDDTLFDLSMLSQPDSGEPKGIRGRLLSIFSHFFSGRGGDDSVFSVDTKMADLLKDPRTYALFEKYCPKDILEGEELHTAARMGLTLRKIQKLVPQDLFPPNLLDEVDALLREIPREEP